MNYIVGYKINTTGTSEGLTIPSGFTILVIHSVEKSDNSENPASPFKLEVQVCTFKTDQFNDVINKNDDLIAQGFGANGNTKTYNITSGDLNSAVRTIVRNNVKPDLDAAYGSANVAEL